MTLVRLNVIGHGWGGMFNYPASTCRLIDCALAHNRSVDEWYNVVPAEVNLAKYPPETAKILQWDIFWFFLRDEDFVSKTISDGSVDLEIFPASKVRQLAKKLESSKATACHIKQVAGDLQAAQINLLRHQHTVTSWEI